MALGFFDGDTQNASPESIRRKRELAARLLAGRTPRTIGEGFGAIGDGIAAAILGVRASNMETEGNKQSAAAMQGFFGGGVPAGVSPVASSAATAAPVIAASPASAPASTGPAPRSAPGELASLFSTKEQAYNLPQGFLTRTAQIESSFNPNAKNPNSSATGLFQFINSTARQYGLDNPRDPVASTAAAARLAADNRDFLMRRLGREPTAGELYLAHQQGAGGAANLLANPNAPVEQVVGSAAARLNGGRPGMTASQFASRWTSKFDGMPQITPGPGARAMPLSNSPDQGMDMSAVMPDAGMSETAVADMGAPVPVATTEEEVQALEAQMAAAQAGNQGDVFSPIPMGGGFNPFVPREIAVKPADVPAPQASPAALVNAPMPPQRPADLGPVSPFVPAAMRQQEAPFVPQSDNDVAGAFARSGAMNNVFPLFGSAPQAQMAAQAPQAVGESVPASAAVVAPQAAQAPAQATPANRMQQLAAVMASPMVRPEVKQLAMAQFQQEQAQIQAEQERARVRGDSEAAAKAAGLDPALVGDKTILGQAAQARFNRLNNQPRRSLQPVFGVDAQGRTVMLQPGEDGTAVQTQMPAGVTIASGVDRIDAGTKFILMDKRTGQVVGEQPKDLAGAEREKALGKDAGDKIAGAPEALATANQTLASIDGVLNDPNLGWATGAPGIVTRNVPGTPTFGTGQRIEQLQGRAFLQAFESLKGGGAITEIEGQKATQAIARLNARQSEKDFREALQELRGIVQTGRDRVAARIGQQPGQAAGAQGQSSTSPQTSGALQAAREAIAKGADRQKVIDRLRQNGIDPGGL